MFVKRRESNLNKITYYFVYIWKYRYFCVKQKDVIMSRTIFNEAQLELLSVMASVKDDAELMALKHAISEFFARRAAEE